MNKDINLQESEKNDSDNSEKVLIITALVMFAVLIGYNAFMSRHKMVHCFQRSMMIKAIYI